MEIKNDDQAIMVINKLRSGKVKDESEWEEAILALENFCIGLHQELMNSSLDIKPQSLIVNARKNNPVIKL